MADDRTYGNRSSVSPVDDRRVGYTAGQRVKVDDHSKPSHILDGGIQIKLAPRDGSAGRQHGSMEKGSGQTQSHAREEKEKMVTSLPELPLPRFSC